MRMEREGLNRYTHYLRQRIAAHMQRELDLGARPGDQGGAVRAPHYYYVSICRVLVATRAHTRGGGHAYHHRIAHF